MQTLAPDVFRGYIDQKRKALDCSRPSEGNKRFAALLSEKVRLWSSSNGDDAHAQQAALQLFQRGKT